MESSSIAKGPKRDIMKIFVTAVVSSDKQEVEAFVYKADNGGEKRRICCRILSFCCSVCGNKTIKRDAS